MDFSQYLRFVAALIAVLALIGVVAVAARRFGLMPRATGASQGRRLQVVEVAPVDARRRLVLIRRDAVEHLVLLGQNADLLVESGIAAAADNEAAP
ncbi:MAG TPA: flagellar biosynthetic protein FliO, partial [Candidatus Sulfotelmatobacter sp.]|nr:flagellar biosynthetic protein FliO [Candidatus Sulfotelmatobacter sp.]